jgi:hypothetical protein
MRDSEVERVRVRVKDTRLDEVRARRRILARGHIGRALQLSVVAAGLVALGAPIMASAAPSAGGVGLAPAHVDPNNSASRAYFILDGAPGQRKSDAVVVTNTADTATDLLVNAVDGVTGVTSGAVYANRQDPVRRAGAWVTPASSTVTVPPKSRTTTVAFTLQVPADATPGDHLAGLAFENAHPATTSGNLAVTTVTRSVIGVLVHVPGPAFFHLHVDRAEIQETPGAGGPSVLVTLGNDGGMLGKPTINVTLSGPAGYHQSLVRQLDTILPGDTIPFPVPWPESLARGDYQISVSGSEPTMSTPMILAASVHLASKVLAAQATAPSAAAAAPASSSGGIPVWLIAALLGTAILGAGGGSALAWRLARRR